MKKILIVLMLVCLAVAATGCMGLSGNSPSGTAQRTAYAESSDWQGLASQKSQGVVYPVPVPASVSDQPGVGSSATVETKIIKTAQITVEVKDVIASADALKALALQNNGYLSSSSIQRGYNNRLSAVVVSAALNFSLISAGIASGSFASVLCSEF